MSELLGTFGRLHPLLVHLPIGFLVALGLFELLLVRGRVAITRESVCVLVWLAALSAAVTALAGWVLAREPGYSGEVVENHESLGIAVAVTAGVAALAHGVAPTRRRLFLYRVGLLVALALLFPAGHLGSTLTHGADWLEGPAPSGERADGDGAPSGDRGTYASAIAPIFAAKCASCHGEAKQRGRLRLDAPEWIQAGSEDGPVLVAGVPEESELLRRLRLPLEHEDHMPPEAKPQPSADEIARLEAWIRSGASFEGEFELPATAPASAPAEPSGTGEETESSRAPGAPAGSDALLELERALVHVEPLAQGSELRWIDVAAVASAIDDAEAERLLAPVAPNVAQLSLARSAIGDTTLALCARMEQLVRLDLSWTKITSRGLAALAGHRALAELVLVGTPLDDAAVEGLLALPALEKVSVWGTGLPAEALARLREQRPALAVHAGDEGTGEALEIEPELVFTGDAPVDEGEKKTE